MVMKFHNIKTPTVIHIWQICDFVGGLINHEVK
jgi:hypothetical protein|nr:MAG TPA: hypothetical protein [Caudoviricetes sp.]